MLFELAGFGMLTDRGSDDREPGNLRTIALPLRMALAAHRSRPTLSARLMVDVDKRPPTDSSTAPSSATTTDSTLPNTPSKHGF